VGCLRARLVLTAGLVSCGCNCQLVKKVENPIPRVAACFLMLDEGAVEERVRRAEVGNQLVAYSCPAESGVELLDLLGWDREVIAVE